MAAFLCVCVCVCVRFGFLSAIHNTREPRKLLTEGEWLTGQRGRLRNRSDRVRIAATSWGFYLSYRITHLGR